MSRYRYLKPAFGSPVMGNRGSAPPPPKTVNLILDGNSLTALTDSYPAYLAPLLKSGYTYNIVNYGVSGQTTRAMNNDAATQVDIAANKNKGYNILFMMEGINDIYYFPTEPWESFYNNIVTYCNARRAYGFKVIVGTLTPRSNPGTPASQESTRLLVNAEIRRNWQTFANAIVDIGGDPLMGDLGDELNLTYYKSDLVHFAPPTGSTRVAQFVADQVNSFLP